MPKKTSSISSRGISIRVSRGSGKTFVLKNWETDGFAAFLGSTAGDIPQNVAGDLIAWLSAPQRGVTRARNEAHDSSALVLNGAEVNRVLDYAQNGLRRVINAVVPRAMRTCSLVRPTMRWYMVPTRNRCNRASHRLCRQSKN